MDIAAIVAAEGGFATTARLRQLGLGEWRLAAEVTSGRVRRVRRGMYSTREPGEPQCVAAAMGGRLTGVSAIEAMAGWVWRGSTQLHVTVAPNASRFIVPRDGVIVHWESPRVAPESITVAGLVDCLVRLALDADLETATAGFDWALHSGRLDRFEFERVLLLLPARARGIRAWVDEGSQSVLESVARVRLLRRGWSVQSQVRVGDVEAIDLVIEDQVALELDGREFHEAEFERDRRKDLAITAEGRHSIRLSYSMVTSAWPEVERAIEVALSARQRGNSGFSGVVPPVPKGQRRTCPLPRFDT